MAPGALDIVAVLKGEAMGDGEEEGFLEEEGFPDEEMLDAVFPEGPVPAKPPGRNDPCPCGSGKKYKKCCGRAAGPDASVPERDDGGDPAGPSLHVG